MTYKMPLVATCGFASGIIPVSHILRDDQFTYLIRLRNPALKERLLNIKGCMLIKQQPPDNRLNRIPLN